MDKSQTYLVAKRLLALVVDGRVGNGSLGCSGNVITRPETKAVVTSVVGTL